MSVNQPVQAGSAEQSKTRLALIATGGTIAGQLFKNENGLGTSAWGYQSASLSASDLLQQATGHGLEHIEWARHQPYSIGSQNLQPSHMRMLGQAILQAANRDCEGVVLTHGTDTMEDMLCFLYLTLPEALQQSWPIVFTGAMRPSDDPNADGPANLGLAAALCLHWARCPGSQLGLVMNGFFTPAMQVAKRNTADLNTFTQPASVPVANILRGHDQTTKGEGFSVTSEALSSVDLPQDCTAGAFSQLWTQPAALAAFEHACVPVVYCTPGDGSDQLLDHWAAAPEGGGKPDALVIAAPGHGNIPASFVNPLRRLLNLGVDVVRATRVPQGGVIQGGEFFELDDYKQATNPVGHFSEQLGLTLPQSVVLTRLRIAAKVLQRSV